MKTPFERLKLWLHRVLFTLWIAERLVSRGGYPLRDACRYAGDVLQYHLDAEFCTFADESHAWDRDAAHCMADVDMSYLAD